MWTLNAGAFAGPDVQIDNQLAKIITGLRELVDFGCDSAREAKRLGDLFNDGGNVGVGESLILHRDAEEVRMCEFGPLSVLVRGCAAVVGALDVTLADAHDAAAVE